MYVLFFRAQVLPHILYESMKIVAILVKKKPVTNYNEYLDQKKDFSYSIYSESFLLKELSIHEL
jgi:hypothetical protein